MTADTWSAPPISVDYLPNQSQPSAPVMSRISAQGDLNGDGRPDLVQTLADTRAVEVFLRSEDGSLPEQGRVFVVPINPVHLTILDVNHDDKPDILCRNDRGQLCALLGDGTGNFVAPNYSLRQLSFQAIDIATFAGQLCALLGDCTGNFVAANYSLRQLSFQAIDIATFALDGVIHESPVRAIPRTGHGVIPVVIPEFLPEPVAGIAVVPGNVLVASRLMGNLAEEKSTFRYGASNPLSGTQEGLVPDKQILNIPGRSQEKAADLEALPSRVGSKAHILGAFDRKAADLEPLPSRGLEAAEALSSVTLYRSTEIDLTLPRPAATQEREPGIADEKRHQAESILAFPVDGPLPCHLPPPPPADWLATPQVECATAEARTHHWLITDLALMTLLPLLTWQTQPPRMQPRTLSSQDPGRQH